MMLFEDGWGVEAGWGDESWYSPYDLAPVVAAPPPQVVRPTASVAAPISAPAAATRPAIAPASWADRTGSFWQPKVDHSFLVDRNNKTPEVTNALNAFYAANRQSDQYYDGDKAVKAEIERYLKEIGYGGPLTGSAWDVSGFDGYKTPEWNIDVGTFGTNEFGEFVYTPPVVTDETTRLAGEASSRDMARLRDFAAQNGIQGRNRADGTHLGYEGPLDKFLRENGLRFEEGIHQVPGQSQWTAVQRLVDANGNVMAVDSHNNRYGAGDRFNNAAQLALTAMAAWAAPQALGYAAGSAQAGAAAGAAAGGTSTLVQGGSIKDALKAAAIGGVTGGAMAPVAGAAKDLLGNAWTAGSGAVLNALPESWANNLMDFGSGSLGSGTTVVNAANSLANAASSVGNAAASLPQVIVNAPSVVGGAAGTIAGGIAGSLPSLIGGASAAPSLPKVEVTAPKAPAPAPVDFDITGPIIGAAPAPAALLPSLPPVEIKAPQPARPAPAPPAVPLLPPAEVSGLPAAMPMLPPVEVTAPTAPPAPPPDFSGVLGGLMTLPVNQPSPPPPQALPPVEVTAPKAPQQPDKDFGLTAPFLPATPELPSLPSVEVTAPKLPEQDRSVLDLPPLTPLPITPTPPLEKLPGLEQTPDADAGRPKLPKVPEGAKPPGIRNPMSSLLSNGLNLAGLKYLYDKTDSSAERAWGDYQKWSDRINNSMTGMEGFLGKLSGEYDGLVGKTGGNSTFKQIGDFDPGNFSFTRQGDPATADYNTMLGKVAGTIDRGSSATGELQGAWRKADGRADAALADVNNTRRGVDDEIRALGDLREWGENDVRRISDASFNNKSGSVDRALQLSASEGFANALSRGVSNSTIAGDTRDNIVRKFSDVYGQLRDGSDRTAMQEVQGLSNLQLSQRGQRVSEIKDRNNVQAALEGLRMADSASANAMGQFAGSATGDAARRLQASTTESSLAQQLKQAFDTSSRQAAEMSDRRDLDAWSKNFDADKAAYDYKFSAAKNEFDQGSARLNALTTALTLGQNNLANTAIGGGKIAGENFKGEATARAQAMTALVTAMTAQGASGDQILTQLGLKKVGENVVDAAGKIVGKAADFLAGKFGDWLGDSAIGDWLEDSAIGDWIFDWLGP